MFGHLHILFAHSPSGRDSVACFRLGKHLSANALSCKTIRASVFRLLVNAWVRVLAIPPLSLPHIGFYLLSRAFFILRVYVFFFPDNTCVKHQVDCAARTHIFYLAIHHRVIVFGATESLLFSRLELLVKKKGKLNSVSDSTFP